jgi:tetratricopeptide (TPR) repeat protein
MAWLVLVVFDILSPSLFAADAIQLAVEQAQAQAVKKNRKEAAAILNRAYITTSTPTRGRSKLIESLAQIGQVFFTDKGQRIYEASQSLVFENPDLAIRQLSEANRLEDDNLLILASLARAQIVKGDCDAALVNIDLARGLNSYSAEIALLELRGLLCAKRTESLKEKLKQAPVTEKADQAMVHYFLGQEYLNQKLNQKAHDSFLKATQEIPQFAEAFYFLAKASKNLERDPLPWMTKYSQLCKMVTIRERKKFASEPLLCGFHKEVENELSIQKSDS